MKDLSKYFQLSNVLYIQDKIMKAGHYYKWAEKSFKILDKFHSRMYELGGEESDLWNDDLNCNHHDLERALEDDNYDRWGYDSKGYFKQLENQDTKIKNCDWNIESYKEQIKLLNKSIKAEKLRQSRMKHERLQMIEEFDMDYKTIESRLTKRYPEFVEKSTD